MEKIKSYIAAVNGIIGTAVSLQEAETIGKLVILGLTGISILFPLCWAFNDRRRRLQRENGETIISDAMLEIIQAMTPAEMEAIRVRYLGHRSRILDLPVNSESARQFVAGARKVITAAWIERLNEIQPSSSSHPVPSQNPGADHA